MESDSDSDETFLQSSPTIRNELLNDDIMLPAPVLEATANWVRNCQAKTIIHERISLNTSIAIHLDKNIVIKINKQIFAQNQTIEKLICELIAQLLKAEIQPVHTYNEETPQHKTLVQEIQKCYHAAIFSSLLDSVKMANTRDLANYGKTIDSTQKLADFAANELEKALIGLINDQVKIEAKKRLKELIQIQLNQVFKKETSPKISAKMLAKFKGVIDVILDTATQSYKTGPVDLSINTLTYDLMTFMITPVYEECSETIGSWAAEYVKKIMTPFFFSMSCNLIQVNRLLKEVYGELLQKFEKYDSKMFLAAKKRLEEIINKEENSQPSRAAVLYSRQKEEFLNVLRAEIKKKNQPIFLSFKKLILDSIINSTRLYTKIDHHGRLKNILDCTTDTWKNKLRDTISNEGKPVRALYQKKFADVVQEFNMNGVVILDGLVKNTIFHMEYGSCPPRSSKVSFDVEAVVKEMMDW